MKVWECPNCKFCMADEAYLDAVLDFECPRCRTPFSYFNSRSLPDGDRSAQAEAKP